MSDTKSTILVEAIRLFSEQGYNGVSMRAIAAAVGISAAALYNHFADKRALYEAAVAAHFGARAAHLTPALALDAPPRERLRAFVERLCALMAEDVEFRRLVQWELLAGDAARLEYLAKDLFEPLFRGMMDLLRALAPEADAHRLAVMLIGMIQKPFELYPLARFLPGGDDARPDPGEVASQALELLFARFGESK